MLFILKDSDERNNVFQRVEDDLRRSHDVMFINKAKSQFSAVTTREGVAIIHSMAHPLAFSQQNLPYATVSFEQIKGCVEDFGDVYFLTPNCVPGIKDEDLLKASLVYSDREADELRYCHNDEIVRTVEYSMCAVLFSAYKVPDQDCAIIVFNNKCVEVKEGGDIPSHPVYYITMNQQLRREVEPTIDQQVGDFIFCEDTITMRFGDLLNDHVDQSLRPYQWVHF